MSTMYGYDVESFRDPVIAAADQSTILTLMLLTPGGCLMNIIPILRNIPAWFPGAISRRIADKTKELTEFMQRVPLEFVKTQVVREFLDAAIMLIVDLIYVSFKLRQKEPQLRLLFRISMRRRPQLVQAKRRSRLC